VENAAQLLRLYGLRYKGASRERAFFKCAVDKGIKAVKKAENKLENIEAVLAAHMVKEKLYACGIATNRFDLANDGLPYAVIGNDLYTVSNYINANPVSFAEPEAFMKVVAVVAKMHKVCRVSDVPLSYSNAARSKASSFCVEDIYQKNVRALREYKRYVHKKSHVSDFDIIFVDNYDRFMAVLSEWKTSVKETCREQLECAAIVNKNICHNLLKEENVLIGNNGELILTGFSQVSLAHGMNDLAALIKRYVKARPEDIVSLEELLEVYGKVNTIGRDETRYLKSLLLFPDKFLEICHSYYSKRRAFTPRAFESRMETFIENYEFYERYIGSF